MVDRPIIFSAPMVHALLAGRKPQTRRMIKIRGHRSFREFGPSDTKGYDWHFRDAEARWHDLRHAELLARLRWQAGDRLWAKETWSPDPRGAMGYGSVYRADGDHVRPDAGRWRSPIHMPRWASRLTLTVTDVRVQRLQEITDADAEAEGATGRPGGYNSPDWCMDWSRIGQHSRIAGRPLTQSDIALGGPIWAYASYWNELHGPGAWDANPWIVALTSTVEKRNIDA